MKTSQFPTPFPIQGLMYPFVMAVTFALRYVMTGSLSTGPARANLFIPVPGVLLALSPIVPVTWSSDPARRVA